MFCTNTRKRHSLTTLSLAEPPGYIQEPFRQTALFLNKLKSLPLVLFSAWPVRNNKTTNRINAV